MLPGTGWCGAGLPPFPTACWWLTHPAAITGVSVSARWDSPGGCGGPSVAVSSNPTRSGPPRWPSGKASASRAEDPGFEFRLRQDFFGLSHTSDSYIALQWLPCQASGIVGSALGLVGPVSVYCDWVR